MPASPLTFLIVDDDEEDRLLLCSYIEELFPKEDFRMDCAGTFREALALIRSHPYDLSFFDYQLGPDTGLELFKKVRADGVRMPIVFLTGQGGEEVAAAVIKAGATDYLPKSKLNSSTLLEKIKNAIEFHRAEEHRLIAEQRLQNSEQQYRALFDNSLDAILILDESGHFTDANAMACEVAGVEKDEIIGRQAGDFAEFPFEFAPKRFLQDGRARGEFSLLRSDGASRTLQISSRAHFLSDKHLVIARDITEEKRAEEEHRKLEHQLRQAQKMEAIGRLAGGIAHDFNNLLMVITSHAELIVRKLPQTGEIGSTVETIIGACDKASSLTEQLLAFSKQQVLAPKVLELNLEIMKMENLLKPVLGGDLALETSLAKDLGMVKVDPGQITQVILNLAVNARDAMPRGGRLTISTRNLEVDAPYATRHTGMKLGSYVVLSVADNGAGMNATTQSRIFEPFFTTKGIGEGTGLGLATVYGIVQQSGGYIAVESQLGNGTKFSIYLPRTEEPLQPADEVPELSLETGSKTVLLVEDEKDLLRSLSDLLKAHGYSVIGAMNGNEAKMLLQQHGKDIDVLITDVVMPGMGGDELAEHVRATQPEVKILFISGGTLRLVSEVKLPSNTKLLHKPFSGRALIENLQALIG
ncbi:MAG: response receiver sensor histidine kinase response regulator [Acidobacteriales bacterium]|nr:response receiver sensor histidine kinase response regulator [Terriglobales bacterium]